MTMKQLLKRFYPLTMRKFEIEAKNRDLNMAAIIADLAKIKADLRILTDIQTKNDNLLKAVSKLAKRNEDILSQLSFEKKRLNEINVRTAELLWADTFNSTLNEEDKKTSTYSPGRWAIGYPYLYAMYRILNDFKPKRILELGLGQSTVMITRYVGKHPDVEHTVVDHDQDWIDFFSNEHPIPENSKILRLDLEFVDYNNASGIRVFKDFAKEFEGKTFDFISIDAPLGGDMKDYSRIDVLLMLPNILAKDFVIMIDDTNRKQETNTVEAMTKCLSDNRIEFKVGRYKGQKECTVICAEHLGFFTSM